MKTLTIILIILFAPILASFLYIIIRDMIFPEIGIYKANMSSFKAFYHHWKNKYPTAKTDEFPVHEALLKILKARYPNWNLEQREYFCKINRVYSIHELIFEIAKNELPPNVLQRYKKRYGERI